MSFPRVMRRWSERVRKFGSGSKLSPPAPPMAHPRADSPMRNKNLVESFAHAFEGLAHVMWTQPHVRIQLFIVVLVLMLSYVMKLQTLQVLFVLSAVAMVLIAELFNTALEVVVNLITDRYHPLAKIAKDVAAAGVLIASIYSLLVGGAIFLSSHKFLDFMINAHSQKLVDPHPIIVLLMGFTVISIVVALGKIRAGHSNILRGGAISGHAAVAFMLFALISVQCQFKPIICVMAFFLAFLVAQSRVEGHIHTLAQVIWGATLALAIVALLMLIPLPHRSAPAPAASSLQLSHPALPAPAPAPALPGS